MNYPPVFITGCPRSGTTLLGNIVDRHPRIAVFVESFFMPRYYFAQMLYWPLSKPQNQLGLARSIAAEDSSRRNGLQCCAQAIMDNGSTSYAGILDDLMVSWAQEKGKVRWGDKSPGYMTKLRILRRMYPSAKIVHIIRDGRDTWLSLKKLGWERNIVKVAREWQKSVSSARRFARRHLRDDYLEVRYEDLISQPEPEIRTVMDFIGEEFSDELFDPKLTNSRNSAFSDWPLIHDTIKAGNCCKWREELSQWELGLFEDQAGPMLKNLGYELACSHIPSKVRFVRRMLLVNATIEKRWGQVKRGSTLFWYAAKTRLLNRRALTAGDGT